MDSRAIAAWLCLHPHRHSVGGLQAEFGLRRTVWQRVRSELQAAGYIQISGPRRAAGHWDWDIRATVPVDNSGGEHMCRKPADEVMCRSSTCRKPADTEVLPKPEVLHENCPRGQAPVDNSNQGQASRKKKLFIIQNYLQLSKSQLGHILTICKANNCQLQDVYRSVDKYMDRLTGNQAVAYLKKCILENPGRDWTWEIKKEERERFEKAQAQKQQMDFENFTEKLAQGEEINVRSKQTGEALKLKHRTEAKDFVFVLGQDGQVKGSIPSRMAFYQFISPHAE